MSRERPRASARFTTHDSRLTSHDRTARLREAIAGWRGGEREEREAIDLTPKSAHEAITRQMVADLAADLAEVKARVNAILWLVAGAVIVDVAMRLAGVS